MSETASRQCPRIELRVDTVTTRGFRWVAGMSADQPCPDCGGDTLYPEPWICYGGPDDQTEGVACMECSFSRLDFSGPRFGRP
jgi:hypothetical protein